MRRARRRLVTLCAALLLGGAGSLSADAVPPKTLQELGVAAFERTAPPGIEVPEVGMLLAERLRAEGTARVVGPDQLAAEALANPSPERVREWASRAKVEGIVTGRITRLGRRFSIDARLHPADGGALVATFVEEAAGPETVSQAVERLAARIAATARPAPAVASAPPEAASAAPPQPEPAPRVLRSDAPISIRSDELEVREEGGRRRLLFTRNVRVSQEDVTLEADRLEGFYPAGSSQPERLVAQGSVRVAQGDLGRRMRCQEATYFRADQRVLCVGDAELEQGEDRVRGERIEIFLDTGRLRVSGGATVNFRPRPEEGATP